ncbi:MAG: elongation factor G [Lentisphaeria bacterium]|nr:elongation factor G [Lentisphaeria bacterium]
MTSNIRNISIIAHIDAGKTSTTEGILYYSGLTHRYGSIDDGTTVMDFLPEERARGITIAAAAASVPWKEHSIHLIDTPGHIDFTAEVERSLRVIDGAVVVFSAVEGVEAQSEKVWRQADRYEVPKIAFINKMDRVGASFDGTVAQINDKFSRCALPLQIPLGCENTFAGLIDVLTGEQVCFSGERNAEVRREPLSAEQQDVWKAAYSHVVERVADFSDEVAELFLTESEVPLELLRQEIRRLTLARQVVPVFVGSAKKSIGIQPLMDGVIDYLPSPLEVTYKAFDVKTEQEVTITSDPGTSFTGFIFKVNASNTADLFFIRVYSGVLKANATVINTRSGDKVRARQLYRIYAKSTEQVDEVGPGEIVGVTGLKDCGIGDTLCEGRPLLAFDKIGFPDPVISMVVEPKFSKDKDRLDEALALLCREDQTLCRSTAEDTGQRLLSGMGELHLEVNLKRVAADFNVEIRCGEPRVAYRETLKAETVQSVVFEKTLGDTFLFAGVKVAFRPLPRGGDIFTITSSVRDASLPRAFLAAAERALHDGLRTGGLNGYPMIYVGADILELKFSPDTTTEGAVAGAALQAIDQALAQVGTVILEPLMHLEVVCPEDTVGEISMYLQPRRAIIRDIASVGGVKKIVCEVPLAEMFGFGKALPRLSGGRGTFSMEPSGYQELPAAAARHGF